MIARRAAGACIDAYEDGARAGTQLLHTVAGAVTVEPVRSLIAAYADATRDVVAAQVSSVRWLLDL